MANSKIEIVTFAPGMDNPKIEIVTFTPETDNPRVDVLNFAPENGHSKKDINMLSTIEHPHSKILNVSPNIGTIPTAPINITPVVDNFITPQIGNNQPAYLSTAPNMYTSQANSSIIKNIASVVNNIPTQPINIVPMESVTRDVIDITSEEADSVEINKPCSGNFKPKIASVQTCQETDAFNESIDKDGAMDIAPRPNTLRAILTSIGSRIKSDSNSKECSVDHTYSSMEDEVGVGVMLMSQEEVGTPSQVEKYFKCKICEMSFDFKYLLDMHAKIHRNGRYFKCNMCRKCFKTSNFLKMHQKKKHYEHYFKCEPCGKCYRHKGLLVAHMRTHKDVMPFSCEKCGQSFKTRFNFVMHARVHANEKSYEKAFETFIAENYEEGQIKTMAPKKDKKSKTFERITTTDEKIETGHENIGNNQSKEEFRELGVITLQNRKSSDSVKIGNVESNSKTSDVLKKKNNNIKDIIIYVENNNILGIQNNESSSSAKSMKQSNSESFTKGTINRNEKLRIKVDSKVGDNNNVQIGKSTKIKRKTLRESNKVKEKPYKCPYCEMRFDFECLLNVHKEIHKEVRRYKCIECGLTFMTTLEFEIHQKTHNEQIGECKSLDKTNHSKINMKQHKRTSTRSIKSACETDIKTWNFKNQNPEDVIEKRYKCPHCEMSFDFECLLNVHKEKHKDVKQYKCIECGLTFRTTLEIEVHQKSHKDKKLFKCDECGKSFKLQINLVNHREIHKSRNSSETLVETKKSLHFQERSCRIKKLQKYSCDKCELPFKFIHLLLEHQRTIHSYNSEQSNNDCYIDKQSSLVQHKATHTSGQPISLKQHNTTNTGKKPSCCSYTHTSDNQPSILKRCLSSPGDVMSIKSTSSEVHAHNNDTIEINSDDEDA